MKPVSLRLPADLILELRKAGAARGLDMASHVRSILLATLAKPVSTLDYTPKVL